MPADTVEYVSLSNVLLKLQDEKLVNSSTKQDTAEIAHDKV